MILFQATPYDPSEVDERRSGGHLSKKEVRVFLLLIPATMLLLWPIYRHLKKNTDEHVCERNFQQISAAIQQYAILNDGRFPPVAATAGYGDPTPYVLPDGRVFTWASLIQGNMNTRTNFVCPSAKKEENVTVEGIETIKRFQSSYGMYAPYSAYPRDLVENPDQTALIAETSNFGSNGTYNPLPFKDSSGRPVPYDGFAFAFDNDNVYPNSATTRITRLAYYDTANGEFSETGPSRHRNGIHVLFMSGSVKKLMPSSARVQIVSGLPGGTWAVPPLPPDEYR